MDIDAIIPIIIVILFIGSFIRKILGSGKSRATAKGMGWKELLGDTATRVREELESNNTYTSPEPDVLETKIPDGLKPDDSKPVTVWKKNEGIDSPPRLSENNSKKKLPSKAKEPAVALDDSIYSNYTIKDLRKAIVWSEIIGPPVGLRDE